jgi:hypothetical protein
LQLPAQFGRPAAILRALKWRRDGHADSADHAGLQPNRPEVHVAVADESNFITL